MLSPLSFFCLTAPACPKYFILCLLRKGYLYDLSELILFFCKPSVVILTIFPVLIFSHRECKITGINYNCEYNWDKVKIVIQLHNFK